MKSNVGSWIRSRDLPICRPARSHVAMSDSDEGYLLLLLDDESSRWSVREVVSLLFSQ